MIIKSPDLHNILDFLPRGKVLDMQLLNKLSYKMIERYYWWKVKDVAPLVTQSDQVFFDSFYIQTHCTRYIVEGWGTSIWKVFLNQSTKVLQLDQQDKFPDGFSTT